MKFKYSPGLIGYGAKGTNGTDGLQGLALYFTDFEDPQDFLEISTRIKNSWVLLSNSAPETVLPNGRAYVEGDLFITSRGYVYKITDPINGLYEITDGILSKGEFFEISNPIASAQEGFNARWLNKNDPSEARMLIDNNFSSKSNYLYPSNIYGIDLKNFTRIEYTDSSAFTLYSSGQTPGVDDHQALALIKSNNGFRIGNVGAEIRDTNLTFDVSLLTARRDNPFNINTPTGVVLTNKEKNIGLLFDPNFNINPTSFRVRPSGEYSYLDWNLRDFTDDPCTRGTITFSKVEPALYTASWGIDASALRPMIFHNVDVSGSLIINDLSVGTTYQYQMIIEKDGWERYSMLKEIIQTGNPAVLNVLKPVPPITNIYADASGWFALETGPNKYKYVIDVSTDSITGYTAQRATPSHTWINIINGSQPGPGTYSFDVSLSKNTTTSARSGNINITSEAPTKVITVNQAREERTVQFDAYGKLIFDPPLTDQTVNITIETGAWVGCRGTGTSGRRVNLVTETWTRSGGVWSKKANDANASAESYCFAGGCGRDFDLSSTAYKTATNTFSVSASIDASIYIKSRWKDGGSGWESFIEGPNCRINDPALASVRWRQSIGYAYIKSVNSNTGTGIVSPGFFRYYYWRRTIASSSATSCSTESRTRSSAKPTIPSSSPS